MRTQAQIRKRIADLEKLISLLKEMLKIMSEAQKETRH